MVVEEVFFSNGPYYEYSVSFLLALCCKINCLKTLIRSPGRSNAKVTKLVGIGGHFEKSFGAEDVPHYNSTIRAGVWLFITGVDEFSEEYSAKALLLWLELIRMPI